MERGKLTDTSYHSSGVRATAWQQGYTKELEKPSSFQGEIPGSKVSPITNDAGKWAEDERAADGFIVAVNRSNVREAKEPCCRQSFNKMEGKDEMTNTSISLQDLRRKIYLKAKTEKQWRFWGLYVHVCKKETLREAYRMARENNGAPGIDGVTFDAIEEGGLEEFLEGIQTELVTRTYQPMRNRRKEIPKGKGVRTLGIPCIRDRIVQGALKLILEPIFEADFQDGSYGYRPNCTAHAAVHRVAKAITSNKTTVIDVDLKGYFDNIRHHILLKKIAERVSDDDVMRLLNLILKVNGKRGVPQGGTLSPLLSNIYLNEVDKMLEKAKEVTRRGEYTHIEYARFADDLVILVDGFSKWDWLAKAAYQRLQEELSKLEVQINQEKTKQVDLTQQEAFSFLGFDFRRRKTHQGKWGVHITPRMKARTKLLEKIREVFRHNESQPVNWVVSLINPILRGWVNYFRIGNSRRCFGYIREWVLRKVRRHMMRARKRQGFGWDRWSNDWLYKTLGIHSDYRVRYYCESAVSR